MNMGMPAFREHHGTENTEGVTMAVEPDLVSSDYTDEEASEPGNKVLNIDLTNAVPWRSAPVSLIIYG